MTTGNIAAISNGDMRESVKPEGLKKAATKGFTDVMDMHMRSGVSTSNDDAGRKGYVALEGGNVVKSQLNREKVSDTDKTSQDDANDSKKVNTSKSDDVSDKDNVKDIDDGEDLNEKLAKRLGVDEDVLTQVLSQLGITDLGNVNDFTLKELAAALTGENTVNAILTNEDTMNMYNVLTDFMTQNALVTNELDDVQFDSQMLTQDNSLQIDDEDSLPADAGDVTMTVAEDEIEFSVYNTAGDVKEEKNDIDLKDESTENDVNPIKESDDGQSVGATVKETMDEDNSSSGGTKQDSSNNQSNRQMTDKFIENLNNSIGISNQEQNGISQVAYGADTSQPVVMNDIVRQIVDSVRINISEESTSMEMILNPEHLGKLNLSVTSKAGVMTAQFIVENETAREAIESQIQILKDNLEQQGLKVEAVEVTINNAGNFNNNNDTGENSSNQSATSGGKVKKININLMDEEAEDELDEDEKIIAQVMKQEGSNINFMA